LVEEKSAVAANFFAISPATFLQQSNEPLSPVAPMIDNRLAK